MTLIRTAARERLTLVNRPPHCPASSAGQFVIRADGTAQFDRHYHHFDEFWFVAAGRGTLSIGDSQHAVGAGDILYTPAGTEHDILTVAEELHIFWLSGQIPAGGSAAHLHRSVEAAAKHPVTVHPGQTADHA